MKIHSAPAPRDLSELMAQAYALEREAVDRYGELADVLATHNNQEVAALFRRLASQEALHATEILRTMGWTRAPQPQLPPDAPNAPSYEDTHYLMHPWHALRIALQAEQRAHDFYQELAQRCEADELRHAARQLQADEREHITLLEEWLERVPEPPAGWDEDPDPPRYPH
ncbi:ferritin family protein [Ramlibacter alkalitolerans]|uniref:Ferritin family protein n=1 Tax=Ramlibacter alkalitolerans TaxID=2039631 RepID=A0ABS1JHR2_9BURK|nr:ferritin family protein [Ramlibacter alkalitolerans]MBL0423621.1 ferritin family protein [Ramlibacter alkalitolerans]